VQRLNELEDEDPNQEQQINPEQSQAESDQAGGLHVRRFVSLVDGPDCRDGIFEERYEHGDSSLLISKCLGTAR
jgi:hypothetical protein